MRNSYIISHNEYPAKYSFLTACLNSMDPVKNIEKVNKLEIWLYTMNQV